MITKHIQKAKGLALLIATFSSLVPVATNASFFDWFGGGADEQASYSSSLVSQAGFIYSHAASNQNVSSEEDNMFAGFLTSASLMQPSSVLTVPAPKATTKKIMRVRASAYSSTPDQTDGNPFITANGTRVRDGIIAANFLPFNTLVKIPELYGDKIFLVTDRMNRRYTNTIDIWFPDRTSALQFGRKTVTIEIVGKL